LWSKVTDPNPDPTNPSFDMTLKDGPSALNHRSLHNGESDTTVGVKPGDGYVAARPSPLAGPGERHL
jgi:hypothetical protein